MGNGLHCCRTVANFLWRKEAPGGAECSPLLSTDGSDSGWLTLPEDREDRLLTVTGPANRLAPQRDHFLFPDIILSSSGVPVEPMVCLLVSEEDEDGGGGGGGGYEDQPRRLWAEVETQTEVLERQEVMEVQTQTQQQAEVQTQTDMLSWRDLNTTAATGGMSAVTEEMLFGRVEERENRIQTTTSTTTMTTCFAWEPAGHGWGTPSGTCPGRQADRGVPASTCTQRSEVANQMEGQRENTDPLERPHAEEESVAGPLSENAGQSTLQANMADEGATGKDNIANNANTVAGHFPDQNEPEGKDSRPAVEGGGGGATEPGSADPHVAGTEGDGVRTGNAGKDDRASTGWDQAVRWSDSTVDEQSADQRVTRGLKEHAGLLSGPPVEGEGVTLFLVDRLFLTAPQVKAPTEAPRAYEDGSVADGSDQLKQDEANVREVVSLHEAGFVVRIQAPATETFELQVLMDHEMTCQRTCFSLHLGGVALDTLTELHLVPGIQDGGLVKVVEDSGTGSKTSRTTERESIDCDLPECITPGCKDRPLIPLQPIREDWKPLQCLRVLAVNSWNPPPGNRKMHGDLLYLNVVTVEGRDLNVTASTRGFYLNQSTAFTFNPKPALPKVLCHSLVELLSQVSPVFRKNFSTLQKKRVLQHPHERIATPYQVYTWVAPPADHALDRVRAEESPASRVGQDEHTVGQSRDWNEELQGCRELPRSNLQERLHRERNIFKTNSDFVYAATQGAIAVVDGNVMAMNPGEEPRRHMFIWNNLFFSLGLDVADHYRPLGGNAAAHAAAICELRGVQAYAALDVEGLFTLGTVLVDYHGHRVVAQAIVPGILDRSLDQGLLYGSNDHGRTVFSDTKFVDLLEKTCRPLRIQRHRVLDHQGTAVELCSSVETKGILGNDGRPYILDLLRTCPPDLNFPLSERCEGVPEECKQLGFPRRHRHSLASLRPELIEAFVQNRYELFLNMVSSGLQKLSADPRSVPETSSHSTGVRPADVNSEDLIQTVANQSGGTAVEDMDPQQRQVILDACKAVGSVSNTSFDVRFNPDIPAVVRDFLEHTAVPLDGGSLRLALHQRGVNMRYLGPLLEALETAPERERLSHVQRISLSEVIIRSAKHIFRIYLQDVEAAALSAAVSHFLNCLLSSASSFPDSTSDELLSRRRGRRRRSQGNRSAALAETAWARMTPGDLWTKIKTEAQDYYHFTLESIDEVVEAFGLQKISLLREMAMKTGIQVQLRDYVFESRHRPVFSEEDVINMSPVVKHLSPRATDATRLIQQAQNAVQQGLLRDGYELIRQALTLFSSVCGIQHEDVSTCLRLLARISYIVGEYADALSHQERAVMCSERVQGIDHPQTIQDYIYLALYCFAGGRPASVLRLLYRARYLTLLVSGEDHPQVVQVDSMLGLVLHGLMKYELSLKFLQNALKITLKYHHAASLKCAHSHHLLATVYESQGEFRLALQHEKEAYWVYKGQAGEDHDSTKESSEYLQTLTKQAVVLQRALNHIYSNTPGACIPPPKFSTPSLSMILQQLNITCGILLIPLR
ncbi:hypothetical protein NHX12_010681 [Muraenolepis orangiensis]|uniref:Clu domain-containing protein n=1 Tax=Muraenolepis orangiensis TaxID=630683 RepID=A0A9Q0I972_9TELE|nr:hypothetical protein NHX12_010681 [Muraenolepis orangiensis]